MNNSNTFIPSFLDVCNSIYSIKPSFHGDNDAERQLKLYLHKIFGHKISFPSIVVAGTKGKGSTSKVCESILRSCGWTTLLFTSPHIISIQERIQINGNNISEGEFISLYKEVIKSLNENDLQQPFFPNFFTLMFAFLVLEYQKRNQNNVVAIIEVGLGGKFDWTKFFRPMICVITRLDFDHTEVLGKTPYSIAWNKFGIITKDSTNFTIPQAPLFQEALEKLVSETGRNLHLVSPNWKYEMGLKGPTAEINTSLAISASIGFMKKIGFIRLNANNLDFDFNFIKSNNNSGLPKNSNDNIIDSDKESSDKDDTNGIYNYNYVISNEKLFNLIKEGVRNAHIDGRYQILFCNGIKWCIDGAHTPESILICREWFQTECKKDQINQKKDSLLLCAASKNRDPNEILEILLNQDWKDVFYVTSFGKIEFKHENVEFFNNTQQAIQKVLEIHPKIILVTGSLYLVGETLQVLKKGII